MGWIHDAWNQIRLDIPLNGFRVRFESVSWGESDAVTFGHEVFWRSVAAKGGLGGEVLRYGNWYDDGSDEKSLEEFAKHFSTLSRVYLEKTKS